MSQSPQPQVFNKSAHDGLAHLFFALLVGALLATNALGASLWTHKPASDIKWYRVTDVGSLLVGAKGALYALDGETGQQIWSRPDLAGAEEFEVDTIAGIGTVPQPGMSWCA